MAIFVICAGKKMDRRHESRSVIVEEMWAINRRNKIFMPQEEQLDGQSPLPVGYLPFTDESQETAIHTVEIEAASAVSYPLVVSGSLGLSIEERGREMRRLLGFNQEILAYRLDETSLRMYCRDVYAYLEFAGTIEAALRPATLIRWMNFLATASSPETGRGFSPNTINRMASAVRRLMKEAGKQGLLDAGVADAFRHVEGVSAKALKEQLRKHNRVRIEPETMRQMAQTSDRSHIIGLRNHALFLTLASTGLRIETFRLLKEEQIVRRGDQYAVSIRSKNEIDFRDVPLSREAYQAIQVWLTARPISSPYLFTRFDGGSAEAEHPRLSREPLSAVSVRAIIKNYAASVGLVDSDTGKAIVKPHDLRRYVGTTVAKRFGPKQAQLVLGHKSIKTTLDHYVLEEPEMGITNDLF